MASHRAPGLPWSSLAVAQRYNCRNQGQVLCRNHTDAGDPFREARTRNNAASQGRSSTASRTRTCTRRQSSWPFRVGIRCPQASTCCSVGLTMGGHNRDICTMTRRLFLHEHTLRHRARKFDKIRRRMVHHTPSTCMKFCQACPRSDTNLLGACTSHREARPSFCRSPCIGSSLHRRCLHGGSPPAQSDIPSTSGLVDPLGTQYSCKHLRQPCRNGRSPYL